MAINLAQFSKSGTGFGQGAYAAARQHYSDAQIRSALPSSGLRIGQVVGQTLGGDTGLYQHRGGQGQFGMGTLAKAQAAGMTNAQIRSSLAMSGLRIGDKAAQALNVNPGKTFLGYAPGVQQSFMGNSGGGYPSRPQLAARGYGMNDGTYFADKGYSPTFYIAGGANDHNAHNFLFGTDYDGGPDIGGGYSDPDFHRVNYVPPGHDPGRPFGGWPGGINPNQMTSSFNKMVADNQALLAQQLSAGSTTSTTVPQMNYTVPGDAKVSGVNSPSSKRTKSTTTSFTRKKDTASDLQIKSVNI